MSTTIRVSTATRDRFAALAAATGRPMTQLLEDAADALERRVFFDQMHEGFAALRAEPGAWDAVQRERAVESGSVADASQ